MSIAYSFVLGCGGTPAGDAQNAGQGAAATQRPGTQLRLADVLVDERLAVALPSVPLEVAPDSDASTRIHIYRGHEWSVIKAPGSVQTVFFSSDGTALLCVGRERITRVDLGSQDITELLKVAGQLRHSPRVTASRSRLMVHALTDLTGPDGQPSITTMRIILDPNSGKVLSEHDLGVVSLFLPPVFAGVDEFFVRERDELLVLSPDGTSRSVHQIPPDSEVLAVDARGVLWIDRDRRLMLNDRALTALPDPVHRLQPPTGREALRLETNLVYKRWLENSLIEVHVGDLQLSWAGMDESGNVFVAEVSGAVLHATKEDTQQVFDLRPLPGPLEPLPRTDIAP